MKHSWFWQQPKKYAWCHCAMIQSPIMFTWNNSTNETTEQKNCAKPSAYKKQQKAKIKAINIRRNLWCNVFSKNKSWFENFIILTTAQKVCLRALRNDSAPYYVHVELLFSWMRRKFAQSPQATKNNNRQKLKPLK